MNCVPDRFTGSTPDFSLSLILLLMPLMRMLMLVMQMLPIHITQRERRKSSAQNIPVDGELSWKIILIRLRNGKKGTNCHVYDCFMSSLGVIQFTNWNLLITCSCVSLFLPFQSYHAYFCTTTASYLRLFPYTLCLIPVFLCLQSSAISPFLSDY